MAQVCYPNYWGQGGRKVTRLSPAWAAGFKASLKIRKNLGMVAHIFHSSIHGCCEFEASLGFRVCYKLAWASDTCLKARKEVGGT